MMWTASPERHQVPRRDRWQVAEREAVHENLYQDWDRPGEELFQVHALEREGAPAVTRKLSRGKVLAFFAQAAPCRVGMEACGSSHYWAREIQALGHEVVLIPPAYTKPYVKRGKNDANDAAAICEAMSRPEMRFVPIKSADQQAVLMLHKTRELLVKQRTMTVNALRGHLSEFGLIAPKGIQRVKDLLVLALSDETLPEEARQATAMLASHGDGLTSAAGHPCAFSSPVRSRPRLGPRTAFPTSRPRG